MAGLEANYLEIEPCEIAHFLLKECGQYERDEVNPSELLDYLKLEYLSLDLSIDLPSEVLSQNEQLRAVLSFPDRIVAVDQDLTDERSKFSVLHEIAHYVLPSHQNALYLCDTKGMSHWTTLTFEKEANELAAHLLFKGSFFPVDAVGNNISAATIKILKMKYGASYEATARRFVEQSLSPVMLIVFKKTGGKARIDVDALPIWDIRYCVASPTFGKRFFTKVRGNVPNDVAKEFISFRDIEDSICRDLSVTYGKQIKSTFRGEFFSNTYNIFCLLTPIPEK